MNDLSASKASLSEQLPVLKRGHLWVMALLYLATFGSFIGFSAGFAMLSKTQFPEVQILQFAFFGRSSVPRRVHWAGWCLTVWAEHA